MAAPCGKAGCGERKAPARSDAPGRGRKVARPKSDAGGKKSPAEVRRGRGNARPKRRPGTGAEKIEAPRRGAKNGSRRDRRGREKRTAEAAVPLNCGVLRTKIATGKRPATLTGRKRHRKWRFRCLFCSARTGCCRSAGRGTHGAGASVRVPRRIIFCGTLCRWRNRSWKWCRVQGRKS